MAVSSLHELCIHTHDDDHVREDGVDLFPPEPTEGENRLKPHIHPKWKGLWLHIGRFPIQIIGMSDNTVMTRTFIGLDNTWFAFTTPAHGKWRVMGCTMQLDFRYIYPTTFTRNHVLYSSRNERTGKVIWVSENHINALLGYPCGFEEWLELFPSVPVPVSTQ